MQEHRKGAQFITHFPPVEVTSAEGRRYIQEHSMPCGLLCLASEEQSLHREEKQAAKLRGTESSTSSNTSAELLVLFEAS